MHLGGGGGGDHYLGLDVCLSLTEVLLLSLTLGTLCSDLFVILLKGGKILTSLGELSFLLYTASVGFNYESAVNRKNELLRLGFFQH